MFGSEIGKHVVLLRIINIPDDSVRAKKSGKFSSTRIQFQSAFFYGYDILGSSWDHLHRLGAQQGSHRSVNHC